MTAQIRIYHCVCSQVSLATCEDLSSLAKRQIDDAAIATTTHTILEHKLTSQTAPVVLRLSDGFEKRYLAKCSRCGSVIAYHLDKSQYSESTALLGARTDVLYVLPGTLVATEDMLAGSSSN